MKLEVSPRRGVIYDRNGNELAVSIKVDSVFAVPDEIRNPDATASALSSALAIPKKELLERFDSERSFVWIKRKLNATESAAVHRAKIPGIYFQKEDRRFYPKRELAARSMRTWRASTDVPLDIRDSLHEDHVCIRRSLTHALQLAILRAIPPCTRRLHGLETYDDDPVWPPVPFESFHLPTPNQVGSSRRGKIRQNMLAISRVDGFVGYSPNVNDQKRGQFHPPVCSRLDSHHSTQTHFYVANE